MNPMIGISERNNPSSIGNNTYNSKSYCIQNSISQGHDDKGIKNNSYWGRNGFVGCDVLDPKERLPSMNSHEIMYNINNYSPFDIDEISETKRKLIELEKDRVKIPKKKLEIGEKRSFLGNLTKKIKNKLNYKA